MSNATPPPSFHMTPDEFRRRGHELIEWIAAYQEQVADFPVLSRVQPGAIRAQLPTTPPQQGEPFEAVMADLEQIIMPGLTHWQSPNFYAYFPSNNSGPSILADLLTAGLGVQGMLWMTSPACTELEQQMMDWVVEMLDLPRSFHSSGAGGGVIEDSASSGVLCALLAARERATGLASNSAGLAALGTAGSLIAYCSTQTHSSLEKAMKVAGLGSDSLRLIEVDAAFAMRADVLAAQIAADRAAGLIPFFVCATVGSTSSTAIDPVPEIGRICRAQGLWLHIDSAMIGTAALCPEFRHIHAGIEHADSYVFNPHKWMFTNFDCSCLFVADRGALIRALTVLPEYLRNSATSDGAVVDYRDWQIPLGRRFRALKLWFVMRHYGVEGLQAHIRRHVALAQELTRWIEADPAYELMAPTSMNLVCFRLRAPAGQDANALNEALLQRLNASGNLYLTHTKLAGAYVLRICVGQSHTELEHVRAAWAAVCAAAAELVPA